MTTHFVLCSLWSDSSVADHQSFPPAHISHKHARVQICWFLSIISVSCWPPGQHMAGVTHTVLQLGTERDTILMEPSGTGSHTCAHAMIRKCPWNTHIKYQEVLQELKTFSLSQWSLSKIFINVVYQWSSNLAHEIHFPAEFSSDQTHLPVIFEWSWRHWLACSVVFD